MENWNRTHLGVPGHNDFRHIHFVGIGGVGMSGIAEVLINEGFAISGSDQSPSKALDRLASLGATIYQGHAEVNVQEADLVVVSSAVQPDNIEWQTAKQKRIPVIHRATMLAELMRFRYGVAVSGTHGKTTTTCLLAHVLGGGGLDPTYVIGGQVNTLNSSNARLGSSPYLVAEADESDGSFLDLLPAMAIVTNIDQDHLQAYDSDMQKLRQAFIHFLHKLPFYGKAFVCIDDPGVRAILPYIERPCLTYGTHDEADLQAKHFQQDGRLSCFELKYKPTGQSWTVQLNIPGQHNMLNSLATIGVGIELGVEPERILNALNEFPGVNKRFQQLGYISGSQRSSSVEVLLDYAHHPKELQAVIKTARDCWPDNRLVFVFQPHRYSRTHQLLDSFAMVLDQVDVLLVLDVYPAGEKPLPNADTQALCRSIRSRGQLEPIYIGEHDQLASTLMRLIAPDDKVIMSGAGSIARLAQQVVDDYGV